MVAERGRGTLVRAGAVTLRLADHVFGAGGGTDVSLRRASADGILGYRSVWGRNASKSSVDSARVDGGKTAVEDATRFNLCRGAADTDALESFEYADVGVVALRAAASSPRDARRTGADMDDDTLAVERGREPSPSPETSTCSRKDTRDRLVLNRWEPEAETNVVVVGGADRRFELSHEFELESRGKEGSGGRGGKAMLLAVNAMLLLLLLGLLTGVGVHGTWVEWPMGADWGAGDSRDSEGSVGRDGLRRIETGFVVLWLWEWFESRREEVDDEAEGMKPRGVGAELAIRADVDKEGRDDFFWIWKRESQCPLVTISRHGPREWEEGGRGRVVGMNDAV